eukprot:UN32347
MVYEGGLHFLPEFLSGCDTHGNLKVYTTSLWAGIHGIEVIIFGMLYWCLPPVWRAFDTRTELNIVGGLCCAFAISQLVMPMVRSREDVQDEAVAFLVIARGVGCFAITIMHPTYDSYFSPLVPEMPDRQILSSLKLILNDEEAFDSFRKF